MTVYVVMFQGRVSAVVDLGAVFSTRKRAEEFAFVMDGEQWGGEPVDAWVQEEPVNPPPSGPCLLRPRLSQ